MCRVWISAFAVPTEVAMGFSWIRKDPQYTGGVEIAPELDRHLQSTLRGLHVIGAAKATPFSRPASTKGWG